MRSRRIQVGASIAAMCMLLQACAPAISSQQAEREISSFMLAFVLQDVIDGTGTYVRTDPQPWGNAPFEADIIVWAPPADKVDESSLEYVKGGMPYDVWWLANNRLTEVSSDKAAAIQDYRKTHMETPDASPNTWQWGYYEFGILSLSDGNRKAKVFVGVSCGPLCGTGTIYNLERGKDGAWRVKGSEMKWIS